jgi:plasmid stability protein
MSMASLLLKDIPQDLHDRLRRAAARDHRSLNKEVISLLEAALGDRVDQLPPPVSLGFAVGDDWLEQAIAAGRR